MSTELTSLVELKIVEPEEKKLLLNGYSDHYEDNLEEGKNKVMLEKIGVNEKQKDEKKKQPIFFIETEDELKKDVKPTNVNKKELDENDMQQQQPDCIIMQNAIMESKRNEYKEMMQPENIIQLENKQEKDQCEAEMQPNTIIQIENKWGNDEYKHEMEPNTIISVDNRQEKDVCAGQISEIPSVTFFKYEEENKLPTTGLSDHTYVRKLGRGRKDRAGYKAKKQVEQQLSDSSSIMDNLFIILSAIYGILLVVLGAVIPVSETFADQNHPYFFEAFYIYLYITSIAFMIYMYVFVLRSNRMKARIATRFSFTRTWSFTRTSSVDSRSSFRRRRKITMDTNHHTGSFYLRLGAVGFGIGSMIYSGLNFGQHFQVLDGPAVCNKVLEAVKPLTHLFFTFLQLYFVFLNTKVCIHQYKTLARFGLMHMCGTNICVWFRNIVVETLHEIHKHAHHAGIRHHDSNTSNCNYNVNKTYNLHVHKPTAISIKVDNTGNSSHETLQTHTEQSCYWNIMMGRVVDSAGAYLFPCSIEYSLICAGIVYVMWQNVGKAFHPKELEVDSETNEITKYRSHRLSVDCGGSSRGLFLGIFMFVGAVTTMIAFYVLINKKHMDNIAVTLVHLSEIIIYLSGMFVVIVASIRMRTLNYQHHTGSNLEHILILISLTGVFIFCMFSIIAAMCHHSNAMDSYLSIFSNMIMMIQASMQSVFMMVGMNLGASTSSHARKKPGREFVTFLILCNISLWVINTFETQRSEHNPIQTEFYGHMAWAILAHISVPLGIFFRFHSTVCLSNIWKTAWKWKGPS